MPGQDWLVNFPPIRIGKTGKFQNFVVSLCRPLCRSISEFCRIRAAELMGSAPLWARNPIGAAEGELEVWLLENAFYENTIYSLTVGWAVRVGDCDKRASANLQHACLQRERGGSEQLHELPDQH